MRAVRAGILAGAASGLLMTAFFLFSRTAFGTATPSEMFADRSAPFIPVHLFGILIGLFHGYTALKILGFVSVIGGQIAVSCAAGALYAKRGCRPREMVAIVTVLWIVSVVAFGQVLVTSYRGFPPHRAMLWNVTTLFAGYAVFGIATVYFTSTLMKQRSRDSSRAGFLVGGAAVASTVLSGVLVRTLVARSVFPYDGTAYLGADVREITPNERFYLVTKNSIDPNVSAPSWRLEVAGAVERPATYTFDDLQKLRSSAQETTLMCINNDVAGGLMSNALWKGVSLRTLLAAAGAAEGARRVSLHAADNYIDTISIAKAMDPATLVAYEMNGEALPQRHGYPVRMIVPGLFGEKNVKWLTQIVVETAEVKGFYEKQGWGPQFAIPTHARFDVPDFAKTIARGSTVAIAGVAFAGDRGVSRVQVSTDDGHSWNDATLITRYSKITWRRWRYEWRPPSAGNYRLAVRAFDAQDQPQIATDRPAETEGVTGLHRVTAHVG